MTSSDPRQLIVLCDGTNNTLTGGQEDTNVVKLLEQIRAQPNDPNQLVFYDPGVGSSSSLPGVTLRDKLSRLWDRIEGMATGRGIYENIAQSYRFLMHNYREGDHIFLFGFSRGAFTARCVAGLVNQFGLLQPQMDHLIPTLIQVYLGKRENGESKTELKAIRDQIVTLFAGTSSRQVDIQLIGVWDTVDSVGIWPFNLRMSAKPSVQGKCFLNVRHAMAFDEQRYQFRARPFIDDNGTYATKSGKPATLVQEWFPGSHCDVGGGNDKGQNTLSHISLAWMLKEAKACGLSIDTHLIDHLAHKEARPLHSETYNHAAWALTGLHVRNIKQVELDDKKIYHLAPVAHQNDLYDQLKFPRSTCWAVRRPLKYLLIALAIVLAAYWIKRHTTAGWSYFWNFFYIAGYAYVLSRLVTWSFAKVAGQNKIDGTPHKWLEPLGWALPALVCGALLMNSLKLLVLWCSPALALWQKAVVLISTVLMAPAFLAKWGGLLGVIFLVGLAVFKHFQKPKLPLTP